MTKRKVKTELIDVKELLAQDEDFVRAAVAVLVQAALEAEMTDRGRERRAVRNAVGVPQRLLRGQLLRAQLGRCRKAGTPASNRWCRLLASSR